MRAPVVAAIVLSSLLVPDTDSDAKLITCDEVPGSCEGGGSSLPMSYEDYLWSLPTVNLSHQPDALAITTPIMGLCPTDIDHVSWVIGALQDDNGNPVGGVELNCSVWVSWWGAQWTSGAAINGPTISYTTLAHEIAHCALDKQGHHDPNHTRADWWGPGGKVSQANAAMAAAGI